MSAKNAKITVNIYNQISQFTIERKTKELSENMNENNQILRCQKRFLFIQDIERNPMIYERQQAKAFNSFNPK